MCVGCFLGHDWKYVLYYIIYSQLNTGIFVCLLQISFVDVVCASLLMCWVFFSILQHIVFDFSPCKC